MTRKERFKKYMDQMNEEDPPPIDNPSVEVMMEVYAYGLSSLGDQRVHASTHPCVNVLSIVATIHSATEQWLDQYMDLLDAESEGMPLVDEAATKH